MRTLIIALLPLAVACGPEYSYCVSPCGVRYIGDDRGDDNCYDFREAEFRILVALDRLDVDFGSIHDMCGRLSGWRVEVAPEADPVSGSWFSEHHGTWVAGITYCDVGLIHVGRTDWFNSALAHELVHVIAQCQRGPDGDGHYRWEEDGIYDAIRWTNRWGTAASALTSCGEPTKLMSD